MTTEPAKQEDREQARERPATLRILGGLLLVVALLLYFFHLAEAPMGRSLMGVLALIFGLAGIATWWVGQRKLRSLR